METGPDELTVLLRRWDCGDPEARDAVMPLVYQELREMARWYLRRERPNHTLQETALIHEAYLRLLEQRTPVWQNREHFFGIAGTLMRRILLEHARRHNAEKRGDGVAPYPLDALSLPARTEPAAILQLADALSDLELLDPQKSRVVELRFFMGLSMEEIAGALALSVRTVNREWTIARAWLHAYMANRA